MRARLPRAVRAGIPSRGLALALCLASLGCGDDPASIPQAAGPQSSPGKPGPALPVNWVSNPIALASGLRTASLAATPGMLLASTLGTAPAKLVSLSPDGSFQPFAPGFTAAPEAACWLEFALGEGDWPPGEVFASRGTDIWQLSSDGGTVTCFASLPLENDAVAGLCFDHVGSFGNDLLALTQLGTVYRLSARGRVQRVGAVGPGGRGPSVAPLGFGPAPGQMLVAFPQESDLRGIDLAGNVSLVLRWSGVSGAWFVPEEPTEFARTGSALFLATGPDRVWRYPLRDLALYGGQLVVTSVWRSGSGLIASEGTAWRWRPFSRSMGPEMCAAFVRRLRINHVRIDINPYSLDDTIVLGSTRLVPVGVMGAPDFTPSSVDAAQVVLAGAHPVSRGAQVGTYTDLDHDGLFDLLLQFRPSEMQLQPGTTTLVLEGPMMSGELVRGSAHADVLAP